MGKIRRLINELQGAVTAYRSRMYPCFVHSGEAELELPVFVYHHVRAHEFERHLLHLQRNGYRTITCETFSTILAGELEDDQRNVMLTFDDGFDDLYHTVYPLIRKYDTKVVVYLIAGWIGTDGMLTWNQIREMQESGLFDFQSHGMFHSKIFVDSNPVDVYRSGDFSRNDWNHPETKSAGSNTPGVGIDEYYPLFRAASRFGDARRFIPSGSFVSAFQEKAGLQDCTGNEAEIRQVLEQCPVERGSFESAEEQQAAIQEDLLDSKRIIEQEVPKSTVTHFAYPWFEHGEVTKGVLKELGFKSAVIGMKAGRQGNKAGDDPLTAVRVNGDFVLSLPGKGRRSFINIMIRKMLRRITAGSQA